MVANMFHSTLFSSCWVHQSKPLIHSYSANAIKLALLYTKLNVSSVVSLSMIPEKLQAHLVKACLKTPVLIFKRRASVVAGE